MEAKARVFSLLDEAALAVSKILQHDLPSSGDKWWDRLVVAKLSFQQRQHVEREGLNSLDQLDLAALLRVLDKNWRDLAASRGWPYSGRQRVRDMVAIRNRWAHAQARGPAPDEIYRDLENIKAFASDLDVPADLAEHARDAQRELRADIRDLPSEPVVSPPSDSAIAVGQIVSLKADPSIAGAVTGVVPGEKEDRYQVFHDGTVGVYYESQLVPQDVRKSLSPAELESFHVFLSALQLLHPSVASLYSLHAARIDLIPYQFRPVLRFIRSDRPRFLIADSVGVGKTIEAGLILRELQARHDIKNVLIICPKPLVTEKKWYSELKRFDEAFEHLDGQRLRFCMEETHLDGMWPENYSKAILPFSLLSDEVLHGSKRTKGLMELDPPPQFDLVIVDEAHHIRNTDTLRHQAVRAFCDNAEAVVFLTATPIQLGTHDLFVLLNTLRPDLYVDEGTFNAISEPNPHINRAALLARGGEVGWQAEAQVALEKAAATSWGVDVLQRNPDFQAAYDDLSEDDISREKRVGLIGQIERLHTLTSVMNRTLRRDIGEFTVRKPETVAVPFSNEQQELHDSLLAAQASVYGALYGEQSVNFLLSTIRRQAASCLHGLAPLLDDILTRRLGELEWFEMDAEDEEKVPDELPPAIGSLIKDTLALARKMDQEEPSDPKLEALRNILKSKGSMPKNKVMVFSSFRHTLRYLEKHLVGQGHRIGLIHGGVPDEERLALRERFQKAREEEDALDLLLFSDVGCEGLDYQFCDCLVNYDLPWNPMRIDQRIGRIDRWGQESESVAIYNLITPGTVDGDIYERCLLRIGVFEQALGANEEILGRVTAEINSVADNLSLTPAERKAKLDQLGDNAVRLIHEQKQLEERQSELFGLRLPESQFSQDVDSASSYWLSPEALERLVSSYVAQFATREHMRGHGPRKTLKLGREGRDALLRDFAALPRQQSPIFRDWERWLKGDKRSLPVTFDAAYAKEDQAAVLLSPIHPLCRQAAMQMSADPSHPLCTAIEVDTDAVPPGEYRFAVYEWKHLGIREDVVYKPITSNPVLTDTFLSILPQARPMGADGTELPSLESFDDLEKGHYAAWSDARADHLETTTRVAQYRKSSLEASHRARIRLLDEQISAADNEKIRIMKQAQKENAEADYLRRLTTIEQSMARADITANPIAYGIVHIRSPK